MRNYIILLLSLSCFSCSSNNIIRCQNYVKPEFTDIRPTNLLRLNDEFTLRMTGHFLIYDSVIIFPAISADNDNVFQLLSTNDGHFIKGFANIGRSAEELSDYLRLCLDNKEGIFYALDNANKYTITDLEKVTNDSSLAVVGKGRFKGDFPTARAIDYRNGRLLQMGGYPTDRIFMINENGDTILRHNIFPSVSKIIDQDEELHKRYFLYNSHYAVRPDGKKIANVTTNGMLLEIFDIDNKTISHSCVKYMYEPRLERSNIGKPDCIFGASHICTTNDYIYILYYDAPISEVAESKAKIGVFDWEGNEQSCYELNDMVATFAITPNGKQIYCWAYDTNSEEYLGYFDLK